jgi:hypothetical protein
VGDGDGVRDVVGERVGDGDGGGGEYTSGDNDDPCVTVYTMLGRRLTWEPTRANNSRLVDCMEHMGTHRSLHPTHHRLAVVKV